MLAKKYGVSPKAIRDIWNRRTWQNGTRHLWAENDKPMIRSKKPVPSSCSSGCALSTIANATNLCCRFPGELPSLRSSRPWCCSSLTDFHLVNVPYANSHIDQTQFAITSSSPQIAAQQSPLDPAELYGPAIHDGSECSMKRCLYFREAHTVNPQHVGRSGEVCTIPSLTPTSSPFAAHQHLPYIDRSNAQAGDGSGGGAALATNWQDPFGPCAADQADGCGGTGWEGPFGPCLPLSPSLPPSPSPSPSPPPASTTRTRSTPTGRTGDSAAAPKRRPALPRRDNEQRSSTENRIPPARTTSAPAPAPGPAVSYGGGRARAPFNQSTICEKLQRKANHESLPNGAALSARSRMGGRLL